MLHVYVLKNTMFLSVVSILAEFLKLLYQLSTEYTVNKIKQFILLWWASHLNDFQE